MARMTGKVAVVVGGAKGIGLATARALGEEGASVILTGRRQHEVTAAAESIGPLAQGIEADAASQADLKRVVREAVALLCFATLAITLVGIAMPPLLILTIGSGPSG